MYAYSDSGHDATSLYLLGRMVYRCIKPGLTALKLARTMSFICVQFSCAFFTLPGQRERCGEAFCGRKLSDGGIMCYRLHEDEHGKDYWKGKYKYRYKVYYVGTKRPGNFRIAELKLYQAYKWMVLGVMENDLYKEICFKEMETKGLDMATEVGVKRVWVLDFANGLAVKLLVVNMFALCGARAIDNDIQPPAFVSGTRNELSESTYGFYPFQIIVNVYLTCSHHAELVNRRLGDNTLVVMVEVTKRSSVKRVLMLAIEIHTPKRAILKLLQATDEALLSAFFLKSRQFNGKVYTKGFKSLHLYKEEVSTILYDYILVESVLNLICSLRELQEPVRPRHTLDNWVGGRFVSFLEIWGAVMLLLLHECNGLWWNPKLLDSLYCSLI